MNEQLKKEISFTVSAVLDNLDSRLDGKFNRVHERIDPLVEDVANIKGRLSLFPTPKELDEKIDNRVAVCKENHDEKYKLRSEISKKDWLKIIGAILALIATAFGVDISLQ